MLSTGLHLGVSTTPALSKTLKRRRQLRTGLIQLAYSAGGVGLGVLVPKLHTRITMPGPRASELLIAVGAGTLTFIGVVYSLLFLVMQFGTTTFTPRLNLFRDSQIVWHAFGFFTGVVLYSVTATLVVGGRPRVTALVAIVLVVAMFVSIALYRALQLNAFRSIQLSATLEEVARRGRAVIDGLYPANTVPGPASATTRGRDSLAGTGQQAREVRWGRTPGVLQLVDVPRLVLVAERARVEIQMHVGVGAWVDEGDVVATVLGQPRGHVEAGLLGALTVGNERTFAQDPTFALRLLADIAVRSLSVAVSDPTSALQALDWSFSLLRRLAPRELDVQHIAGRDGSTCIVLVLPTWEDYVGVALDEIVNPPPSSIHVRRRIEQSIQRLLVISSLEHRPALEARVLRLGGTGQPERASGSGPVELS